MGRTVPESPARRRRAVGVDATDLRRPLGPATHVGVPVPDLVGGGGAPGTDRQGGHAGQTTERPAARQTGAMTTPGGARAGIVVTGTEVLTGRVTDRNGPWLAEQLRLRGVDIAHVIVVGDRPEDLRSSLAFLAASGLDLVVTTGGLGPTADDLTAEVVAGSQGRPSTARPRARVADRRAGRGTVGEGAAGAPTPRRPPPVCASRPRCRTAPRCSSRWARRRGWWCRSPTAAAGPPVVVLPGPPSELQPMWPDALATPVVQEALRGAVELRQETVRLWGVPESQLAATMRGLDLADLEITTCLRDGELEVVDPLRSERRRARTTPSRRRWPRSTARPCTHPTARTVDDLVADTLLERGWTIATAESCTAGPARRSADRAGRLVGVRPGWAGRLLQPGQARPRRCAC